MEAYLDNAATTRPFDEVREVMLKTMETDWGNPSSKHRKGMEAEYYLKEAREAIASRLKAEPKEIIFTSGGTESNNLALIGTAMANKRAGNHIITTQIEHPSVYNPLTYLEELGFRVTYLPVNENGHVSVKELVHAVEEDTILVSVMHVNNEIGTVEPIEAIAKALREKKQDILFHVDGIQSFGKYLIYPKRMGIDLLSVSAHKIHGPKGIGFLYVGDRVKIKPVIFGGQQQKGIRSGTENIPGIAGMSCAVKKIYENHREKTESLYELKKRFIKGAEKIEGAVVNGIHQIAQEDTAPHIVSVSFEKIKSEVLLHALEEKGVYVSAGSACASNHPQISGTLKAVGIKKELLDSTLRFSFSVFTTPEEIDYALKELEELISVLRKYTRH